MYKTINITAVNDSGNKCARLVSLIREWLEEKGFENNPADAVESQDAYTLTLKYADESEGEGYIFAPSEHGGVISASCLSGLYAGAGHFLLGAQIINGGLFPPSGYKASVPQKKMRGIYFATHFHNFYHDAPVGEIKRYVEELALWGYNILTVWFDMHHYAGIRDPEAANMITRLRMILEAASISGMKLCLGMLANEGFSNTPDMLKADWRAGRNGYHTAPAGHYHVEICPNSAGGTELILKNREEVCEAFKSSGINFDYAWIWPYDQGGCTCEKCAPWGANGFLKTAPLVAEAFLKYFPDGKIIMSVWYFDCFVDGEIAAFKKAFKNENNYIDYILCEPHWQSGELAARGGEIRGLPVVGFPEISMYNALPWGGFGANPIPRRIRQIWDICAPEMQGGFPYSEGIYEDINKFIISRLYWHGDYDVNTALNEYCAAYFSREYAEDIALCLSESEIALARHMLLGGAPVSPYSYGATESLKPDTKIIINNPGPCGYIYDSITKCDKSLPAAARNSWRWRIVYLRAVIDRELSSNGWAKTEKCSCAYNELIGIYHAQNAYIWVRPPVAAE